MFRICDVTDSIVRRSSSVTRPFSFASSALRISSARARSDAIAGTPRAEALRLLRDEHLCALGLGAATGESLGDNGLEVVDVVEKTAVEPRDLGVEVARHRDVDEEERRAALRRHVRRVQNGLGRAGRRHDDVDLTEPGRDLVK